MNLSDAQASSPDRELEPSDDGHQPVSVQQFRAPSEQIEDPPLSVRLGKEVSKKVRQTPGVMFMKDLENATRNAAAVSGTAARALSRPPRTTIELVQGDGRSISVTGHGRKGSVVNDGLPKSLASGSAAGQSRPLADETENADPASPVTTLQEISEANSLSVNAGNAKEKQR